jgi:hypothetical protein
VLRAYFDESGTHWGGLEASKAFVLCGYVAPEQEWGARFSVNWAKILEKPCVDPPLRYFHAADVEGRGKGGFRRLSQRERDTLKSDAVKAVVQSGLIGIAAGVIVDDFSKVIVGKAREVVGDPYLLCFQSAVIEVCRRAPMFLGEDANEDIAYIFDQHPRWEKMVNDLWLKMVEQGLKTRYRMGSLAFEDKKKFPPLQAADHLAYETYRYMTERPIRPAMRRFLSWKQHYGRYFNEAACLELVEEMKRAGKI